MMRPTNREARKNANRQKLIEATIDSIAELGLSDTTVGATASTSMIAIGKYSVSIILSCKKYSMHFITIKKSCQ